MAPAAFELIEFGASGRRLTGFRISRQKPFEFGGVAAILDGGPGLSGGGRFLGRIRGRGRLVAQGALRRDGHQHTDFLVRFRSGDSSVAVLRDDLRVGALVGGCVAGDAGETSSIGGISGFGARSDGAFGRRVEGG